MVYFDRVEDIKVGDWREAISPETFVGLDTSNDADDDAPEPIQYGWQWYAACEDEGFVNCTFKTYGPCQTVRHQRS